MLRWRDSKRRAAGKVRSGRGQISCEYVPPRRETHPQLCLHLAYILALTDFSTPAVPLLRDLTVGSSRGSPRRSGAAKLRATWDFGPRTMAIESLPGAPVHLRAEAEARSYQAGRGKHTGEL